MISGPLSYRVFRETGPWGLFLEILLWLKGPEKFPGSLAMLPHAGGGNWNGFAPAMLRRLFVITHVSLSAGAGWKSGTAVGKAERSGLKHLLQTQVIEE